FSLDFLTELHTTCVHCTEILSGKLRERPCFTWNIDKASSDFTWNIDKASSDTQDREHCARVLLVRGANKEVKNYRSQTPFQVAIIAGNFELAELIKNHKEA
uniref:Uncharacterized protein n=1 Tax=Hucho hucho TaxID=62062 RepID=A0A4W5QV26_9TELE